MKKPDPKIKQLEEQVADLNNKWKRALADYDNLIKRIEREKNEFIEFANTGLIIKLIDVLQNLDKAEKHIKDQGLTLAVEHLKKIIKEEGVEEIKVLGNNFDTGLMECVEKVKGKENQVVEVINKGYLMHGRVIKPAQVKVGGLK
jgi:molecular chaperone GrpE